VARDVRGWVSTAADELGRTRPKASAGLPSGPTAVDITQPCLAPVLYCVGLVSMTKESRRIPLYEAELGSSAGLLRAPGTRQAVEVARAVTTALLFTAKSRASN